MRSLRSVLVAILPVLLCALLVARAAPAQGREPPETRSDTTDLLSFTMEPVEVLASPFELTTEAAPFAVGSISRSGAALNRQPSLTLESITAGIPGLRVNYRGNYELGEKITMRGMGWRAQFGVRGLQVFLDGIPLTLADGQSTLDIVDPAFVRRVEAIRGPASTFWGNSSGGVLYLSTRPESPTPSSVRARQMLGSYGLSKTEVQLSPTFGPHHFSLYASYQAQDGYRDYSAARLFRTGLTGEIVLSNRSGVRVFGAYLNKPKAQTPGSLSRAALEADRRQARDYFVEARSGEQSEQGQLGATYYHHAQLGTVRATAYGVLRDLENALPFGYITVDRRMGGGRVTMQSDESAFEWGIGAEAKVQRDDRTEFNNDGGSPGTQRQLDQIETILNGSTFGRATLPVGRFRLNAGLRYDRLRFEVTDRLADDGSRTFHALSPSLGLLYDLGTARGYLNWSTALETPTASELSNHPDVEATGFNPDLGPEHTHGLEAGIRGAWPSNRFSYDLALFFLQVNDFLLPRQRPDGATYYENAGQTRHAGAELAVRWELPHNVSVDGSYTYTNAQFTEATLEEGTVLDGNRVPGVSPHRASGSLAWRPASFALSLEYEGTESLFVDNTNASENEGHAMIGARASHEGLSPAHGLTIQPFLAVNNLFDAAYNGSVVVNTFGGRYYEPAAGRNWQAGLTVLFE